jgi:peptide/nickel transport system ATP-binding protein
MMTAASLQTPVLDVSRLTVSLPTRNGTLTVLDDVSLHVAPGEVLGVVGESGAGKSMTGSATIGLLPPPAHVSKGEIRLAGRRIDNLDAERMRRIRGREIGTVFQDPMASLNPLFTIGDQLVETMRTHLSIGKREAWQRGVEYLAEVGIPDPSQRMRYYPHQFSGGMRQRIVVALALCANPKLVIADEPTTALDVSVQAQILGLLKRLSADHGTAVVLITHDMGVIAEMADRVAVMYAGRVAEVGAVEATLRAPKHPYTEGLMGSIPQLGSGQRRLRQIQGNMPRLGQVSPDSCPFAPRCPAAFALCREQRPPAYDVDGNLAHCWLHAPEYRNGAATKRVASGE